MKKNRGDEPVGIIMHIYMEISQGTSLCSNLYHKQSKMSIFFFFPFFFFFYRTREQKDGTGPAGSGGGISGREKWQGKEVGG
jgi:hypothetical protein